LEVGCHAPRVALVSLGVYPMPIVSPRRNPLARRKSTATILAAALLLISRLGAETLNDIPLAWDPSPDANVAGYRLYYASSEGSGQTVDAGTNTSVTVHGLTLGETYRFHVVAYNHEGVESEPSNEVSFIVPGVLRMVHSVSRAEASPRDSFPLIAFPVAPGHTYELQATRDFDAWVTIWRTTGISNMWVEFADPEAELFPSRYYRLRF
jgi:hypothetical protein